ncbi:heme-dependent oxidative N-demethylase family protein [Pseudomonas sp. NPDC087029]|uniref:heme-dependent oxidative N-demethylase family protein n=1 Tax=Pseudomonas sp. NPDC087029 TaxID=3364433 RepID=UPI00380208DF
MTVFKPIETYCDDYTYSNSREAILRLPFPYPEDQYMYSMNVEPHVPFGVGALRAQFDIDEHYISECHHRAHTLDSQPGVHYAALPHMMEAQWDLLELLMECYSRDFPEHFTLEKNGSQWHWINRPLQIDQTFTFGDASTLPMEPMEYITRQAQGEFILLEERDETLVMGAGMATQRADYSLRFNLGMSFMEFHGPVPKLHEMGILQRALKFLLRLRPGHPVRRTNWSITVNPRLETSAETLPDWAPDRTTVTPENAGERVNLRIELQPLHRLPRSNAVLFPVRTYLVSLKELAEAAPQWAKRMHRVIRDLDQELVDYKGFTRYRDAMVAWLSQYDDGTPVDESLQQ